MIDIDPVDLKILKLLKKDGMMTNRQIAVELNLTTTPIHERIKRLRRDGFIEKYTIELNRKKLNKNLIVFCNVSLKEHAQQFLTQFERDVQTVPEVVECYCVSGGSDFLLKVIVSDMEEYKDFILNKLAAISNIGSAQSHFVITEAKHSSIIGE
ncbi:Lrp/AsnC family transcriptional regulator [Lacihabitans sp. CS3-21]|jgi:Lrp/AsnC family leucine-responsive transcriptional regulator|uniref:Lrp/AsnC family transcriptional regulator n=1 Tax=Lacihabitans sp. CS3-21 TaxID=2487332 RepID=UPI0020CCF800|nr:Lrp/AsnC family transcriptional regulator [Lacihabitans sp. CS3-21]MDP1817035.1 Lrp/AsnC family transcriptional regulator [Leadbetterella sp.]